MKNMKLRPKLSHCIAAAIAGLVLYSDHATGQILFSAGTYTQNFDTLAASGVNTWTDNSTLPAWYATKSLGGSAITVYRGTNGSPNNGILYSYGTGTSTDRAFGSVGSGTPGTQAYGVRFMNDNAALAISNITVSYTGEQWRNGGNTSTQALAFSYRISNEAIADSQATNLAAPWTPVPALNFKSPTVGTTAGALDGNESTNRTAISSSLAEVTVGLGQEIFFRWVDLNDAGNDHGLALDDLTISFVGVTPVTNPPSITTQPTNTTVVEGTSAQFSLNVSGYQPFDFQWYYTNAGSATLIDGATGPTFTTNTVPLGISGYGFFVIVTNVAGSATSSVVTLTVNPVPPPIKTNIAYLHTLRDANFVLTDVTNRYQVEGIVTTPANLLASSTAVSSFYMQDDTGGMDVFWRGSGFPFPASGDRVRVTGPLVQFNGFLEVSPTNGNPLYNVEIIPPGGNPQPQPKYFDFASINPTFVEDTLEGSLVIVSNVFIGVTNSSGFMLAGDALFATNLTGQVLRMPIAGNIGLDINGVPPPGPFAASVKGVMQQFDSTVPLDSGYEILLFAYADIVVGTPPTEPSPVSLNIQLQGTDAILTWATTSPPFNLYAAPTIGGTYTIIPGAQSPLTNPITGGEAYFQLRYP